MWEEELVGECRDLLLNLTSYVNIVDQWFWQFNPVEGYSVYGVYHFFTTSQ